jgi:hypothetical protein
MKPLGLQILDKARDLKPFAAPSFLLAASTQVAGI